MDIKQLTHIGLVAKEYYKQVDQITMTVQDFENWLSSLTEPMQSDFRKKGFKDCQGILNFQRFCLEMQDYGMDAFMKEHLSPDDFNLWFMEP
jgi:hypothetical protein